MARLATVAHPRQSRMFSPVRLRRNPSVVLSPLVLMLFIGGWELLVRSLNVQTWFVPKPSDIAVALWRGLATDPTSRGGYWLHAWYTLSEALLGFALGSVLGIAVGTLFSQSRLLESIFRPYIVALQSLPKVAIAPIFIVWFGFGMESKVLIVSLLTFFPMLVNSMAGFDNVDRDRIDLLRSLSASRWKIFRLVQVPSAMPFIFAGLDIAVVYSLLGAIVGEFVGAQRGLGVLILQMNLQLDMAGTFSVFVVLSALGVGLSAILNWVRDRVLFWAPSNRDRAVGA